MLVVMAQPRKHNLPRVKVSRSATAVIAIVPLLFGIIQRISVQFHLCYFKHKRDNTLYRSGGERVNIKLF